MKINLCLIILSLSLIQVQLHLRAEKRGELLHKFKKYIDEEHNYENILNDLYSTRDSFHRIDYNISKFKELLDQYDLPYNYNFFEAEKATIEIKNQAKCGCCWAFAASTSLAYRYLKYGINVSFSPQHALSCYIPDCDIGNFLNDAVLNIVKNGTVTEGCFPYASSDGETMPECPTTCQDKSEYKKYYSQNAFDFWYDEGDNFYEYNLLVMDQLVTEGPVGMGFTVYADFDDLGKDKDKCKNEIYTYNGTAEDTGGHAVTIVGYGIQDNKIYWLIQNSWGADWCDNGFIKMEIDSDFEFGFSEPHISPDQVTPSEIDLKIESQDDYCYFELSSTSLDKWNNSLEVKFRHTENSENFTFQFGRNKILGKDVINCEYEGNNVYYYLKKGEYEYQGGESLGNENTFKLDTFKNKKFTFFAYEYIGYIYYPEYYVSQKGSKIVVMFESNEESETLSPFYLDDSATTSLEKCAHIKTSSELPFGLAYCEITENDLKKIEKTGKSYIFQKILCGSMLNTDIDIIKLDTEKYLTFTITKILKPKDTILNEKTKLILVSNVAGGSKDHRNDENFFEVLLEIENNKKNETFPAECAANYNTSGLQSNLECRLNINENETVSYENIYLLPYHLIEEYKTPFDVIINGIKNAEDEPEPKPTVSSYLEYSIVLLSSILLLLF